MGCTRWAANDGRQTYDGYGLNEACTGRSRFGSRLPSGLSGVLAGAASSAVPTGIPVDMLCDPPPVLAHPVRLDDAQASGMVVQAQAVPVLARVARARAVQAQAAQEQAVQAQAIAVQAQAVECVPVAFFL